VARPLLHKLLLDQVPSEKVLFNKRVQTIAEENDKVRIGTADGSTYEGDILVGADGAYSGVRQRLYEILLKEGRLPKTDREDLPFQCTCLVGQTDKLDLEVFTQLKDPNYPFFTTMCDDKPFVVRVGFSFAKDTSEVNGQSIQS
jgi:2-polyprenyl-6-methoxyphenol hydroxylase-like FAD-dependent oxidoreductase